MPKKKKIEMQKILTGSKTHAVQEPYPNGTQAFVRCSKSRTELSALRYIKILEVLPVNFHLKSPLEQETIIYYFACISQNSTESSANSGTHAARRYRRLLCQHGSLLQSRGKPKLQRDDTGNCTDGQPVCGE